MFIKILVSLLFLTFTGLLNAKTSEIDLAKLTPAWADIFTELKSAKGIRSEFIERRSNPFHRTKIIFKGTLRWHPIKGLSINYKSPSEVILSITESAITITKDGATETLPSNAGQSEFLKSLSALFAWDLDYLKQVFLAQGQVDENNLWTLELNPKDEKDGNGISSISLNGNKGLLEKIEIRVTGGRQIEIELIDTIKSPEFTEAELEQAYP